MSHKTKERKKQKNIFFAESVHSLPIFAQLRANSNPLANWHSAAAEAHWQIILSEQSEDPSITQLVHWHISKLAHCLIVIIILRLLRVKWDIPTDADACLKIEAHGSGHRNVRLVVVDGATIIRQTLLAVDAGVKIEWTSIVEEGIANELVEIQSSGHAVIATFVRKFDLGNDLIVGFNA